MFYQLVKKEMRLQRSNILFAFAVIAIWCLNFLFVFLGDRPLGSRILTTGKLVQIAHYFFALPCLIVIFPLMIGATSVAQERKIGTFDFQAILPVSQRMKWAVKTATAFFLVLFLGGALPLILDYILVRNLAARKIFWIWGDENAYPLPLRFKGLSPAIFVLPFFSMGIYISSFSRDPYRALMAGFGFLSLSFFAQRLIDPAGMLNPSGEGFPDYYVHPGAYRFMIIFLSLVLLSLSLVNYKPRKIKKGFICLQVLFWIIMVNMAGYFALRVEFGITPYKRTDDHDIPGLTKLLGAPEVFFNSSFYAIPNTNKMIGAVLTKQDRKRLSRKDPYWHLEGGNILEIDVETGRIKQKINIYGNVSGFHNKGSYYVTEQHYIKQRRPEYMVTRGGLTLPVGLLDKFRSVPLSLSEDIVPCPEIYSHFPLTIQRSKDDAVDFNPRSFPTARNIGTDIALSHIWDVKKGKNVTLLLKKRRYDAYYPIFSKEGLFTPWISTDEKWFSETRYAFPGNRLSGETPRHHKESIEIYNIDHQTSFTIQSHGKLLILANKGSRNNPYYLRIHSPYHENNRISASSDGSYLAFIRIIPETMIIQGKTFRTAFPKETEIYILELETGKEILVDKILPGLLRSREKEQYRVRVERFFSRYSTAEYDNLIRLEEKLVSMPILSWSGDHKLATFHDGDLRVYQKNSSSGKFEKQLSMNILEALLEGEPRPYDASSVSAAFWSNDILLFMVNMKNSVWKLDLRHGFR